MAVSSILTSPRDPAALVSRLALGFVILPHGAQKLLGWFGGAGFAGTLEFFTGTMGIPWILALSVILVESLGAVALIAGAGTRIMALGLGVTMVVGAWMVHAPNGFFMNWYGNQAGEGFEYHILAAALALVLVIRGGGAWSVDRLITARFETVRRSPALAVEHGGA